MNAFYKLDNGKICAKAFQIFLSEITESKSFVAKQVRENKQRDDKGNLTNIIESVTYVVADPATYCTISVKVMGSHPILTNEDIDNANEPIFIRIPLDQTTVTPYAIEYGQAKVSVVAPLVEIDTSTANHK